MRLAATLDEPESYETYKTFAAAAADRTNVKEQRETRIQWLARALTEAWV